MLVELQASKIKRTLVNLDRVAFVADHGERREVHLAPWESHGSVDVGRTYVDDTLDTLAAKAPWMMRASLVRPHEDARPALVSLRYVAMAEACEEGTLLHLTFGRNGWRVLVAQSPDEVLDHEHGHAHAMTPR